MTRIGSILIPTDFSGACTDAMNRARLIAAEHGSQVTLLNVVNPAHPRHRSAKEPNCHQAVEQAQASLQRYAAAFSGVHDARVGHLVCVGDPIEQIALAARRADLVVIGAKKANPLRTLLFHSPVERLLRLCRRPVLVTRQPACKSYRRLVVPVHLTAYSDAVACAAGRFAPAASIHMLHALQSAREPRVRTAEASDMATHLHHHRVRQRTELRLRAMADSLNRPNVTVSARYGDLAGLALSMSTHIGADVIVASKDGQHCMVDFLLCSTAQRLLSEASCDVLLIPKEWASGGVTTRTVPRFHADANVGTAAYPWNYRTKARKEATG